ncbi:hypothetical protein JVU11DRAFT_1997 [Chiua virens]|nr:hypothetical protein JVU11DRAFT_1997 [Chiua virens]
MHHRCLDIIEVQRTIFHHVRNDSEYNGKVTLARLARVSRVFSNTALDVLWEQLASIAYLIRCLPPDLWRVRSGETVGKMLSFKRKMTQSDWDTFFRYSSRIRTLLDSEFNLKHGCSRLAKDVIFALSHPPCYGPLLPNLKTLFWDTADAKYGPLLQWLFTRSLVNVVLPHFVFCSPEMSLQLTSRCPSLKHVRVTAESLARSPNSDDSKIFSDLILGLHSLESLECHAPNKATIFHISRLPSLVKLSLRFEDDLQLQTLRPNLTPPAFASLESLILQVHNLPTLTSLLEVIRFRPLSVSFTVAVMPTLDMSMIHQFSIALVNACDRERLCKISLSVKSEQWPDDIDSPGISLSTVQPFLTFSNMEFFEFDVNCTLSFNDNALDKLAESWPKLTYLSLNKKSGRWIDSRVTHRGLIKLLSRCAALNEIALSVDFTDIDQPHSEVPSSRPGNGTTSQCQIAHFVESDIKFPVTIAAFLSDICPRLCKVSGEDHTCTIVRSDGWREVNSLLPVFLAVRRQCKKWYTGR